MKCDFMKHLVDAIYPPRCPVCNEILTDKKIGACRECFDNIRFVGDIFCMKCGKPLNSEDEEYCKDCASKMHVYDEGRAALVYDEYMSKSIYRFKYNGKREYASFYGKVLDEKLHDKIVSWNCDCIIPVPIHKSKYAKRGYNQATLIAKQLSKYIDIPVNEHLIYRKNQTEVQKNLSAFERENNLKKAFIVRQNDVKLRSVVIVDDIYTTGSTIDAMAYCLKRSGIEKVYFATLCIGQGF